jgi:hypothetical protein
MAYTIPPPTKSLGYSTQNYMDRTKFQTWGQMLPPGRFKYRLDPYLGARLQDFNLYKSPLRTSNAVLLAAQALRLSVTLWCVRLPLQRKYYDSTGIHLSDFALVATRSHSLSAFAPEEGLCCLSTLPSQPTTNFFNLVLHSWDLCIEPDQIPANVRLQLSNKVISTICHAGSTSICGVQETLDWATF